MTQELYDALSALCDMWDQYCSGECGHMFMSAGENAEEILNKYDLLKNSHACGGDIDYDKLEELRKSIQS